MARSKGKAVRLVRYAWAAPTTLVGLAAGALTLATGGRGQARAGALEFYGGFATWFARVVGFGAMTLGHVILGRDAWSLDVCREHEQAHVRQVERWGFAFIPAYFIASYIAWRKGGHYYHDNWFERDARMACGQMEGSGLDLPEAVEVLIVPEEDHSGFPEDDGRRLAPGAFARDVLIGLSDGLVIPFALAVGLSGAAVGNDLIAAAGLAVIAAGATAMGLKDLSTPKREVPDPRRSLTIAGAYIIGGLVPLAPYMLFDSTGRALAVSSGAALCALFALGFVKGRRAGRRPFRSALRTTLVGVAAAGAAFAVVRVFS